MRCPVCQSSLTEGAPQCPTCQFSLDKADKVFGAPPVLEESCTDLAGVLSDRDEKKIRAAQAGLKRLFPEVQVSVVLEHLRPGLPLGAYTFWLFNRGNLAQPIVTGGNCQLVLFVVDARELCLSCMVGYGLEPLLRDETIRQIVAAANAGLQRRHYAEGLLLALQRLEEELEQASQLIPRAFGLHEEADDAEEDEFLY